MQHAPLKALFLEDMENTELDDSRDEDYCPDNDLDTESGSKHEATRGTEDDPMDNDNNEGNFFSDIWQVLENSNS